MEKDAGRGGAKAAIGGKSEMDGDCGEPGGAEASGRRRRKRGGGVQRGRSAAEARAGASSKKVSLVIGKESAGLGLDK